MFVYLANQGGRSNGEDKRFGRHAFSRRVLEAGACVSDRWLFRNGFDKIPNLRVGWHGNGFPFALRKFFCELLELDIIKDGHHGRAEWLCVQLPDELLQLRVDLSLTMVSRIGNASDLPQFTGPPDQAPKRGTGNAMCLSHTPHAHSGQHSGHSSEIAMETSLLFCGRQHGRIKGRTRNANVGIKGEITFVSLFRENGVKSDIFERRGERLGENGATAWFQQG